MAFAGHEAHRHRTTSLRDFSVDGLLSLNPPRSPGAAASESMRSRQGGLLRAKSARLGEASGATQQLRARVLPRWYGLALIVALPVSLPLTGYGTTLFGLILLALGYALWARRGVAAEQSSRAR